MKNIVLVLLGVVSLTAVACGSETIVEVTVEREVIRTVEVEVPVEIEKEVVREVVREVAVEVPVEKEVIREVVKEVPVEVEKEVLREVVKEVAVEVVVTATAQITTIDAPVKKVDIEGVSRGAGDDVEPSGVLIAAIGNSYFMNSSPRYCPACSVTARTGATETLLEAVRADDGTVALGPLLASDWQMSADGNSYTDFTLREGVQFHGGYGEMTAADVAFSWNDSNPKIQPDSIHDTGGDLANLVREVEVIDDYKVRFHWIAFGGHTLLQYVTNFSEGISVFSRGFFDEVGAEGMRTKMIGTGPFEVTEWTQHKGVFLNAVDNHWRKRPYVASANVLQVTEASVRKAMLKTGQAQIGELALTDWKEMFDEGFSQAPEGFWGDASYVYSGNYWEDKLAIDGQPFTSDEPGDLLYKPVPDTSLPWIGDPADEASMERSKKVRTAMAMAIDREKLMTALTDGFGRVSYAPGWDVNHPFYKSEWSIEHDVAGAQALLAEVGLADGFDVEWWAGPAAGSGETIQEAIGIEWLANLNINSTFDKQNYSSFRPSLVNRTNKKIFFSGGGAQFPPTWPQDLNATSLSRPGGYNRAMEIPIFAETHLAMAGESDPEVLRELITKMFDWNREWMVWVGVYQNPVAALYNPNLISEWQMVPEGKGVLGRMNSLEWVRLAN
ncbi:MAG: ABC transporter substrate-binding protein [Chloroflexi bacterium]|nr:ABC transporter substrate-binding protein [Chloroflexota bacterium]